MAIHTIPELDMIARAECEFVLGASRSSFETFCKLHKLDPLPIRGAGVVYRRSKFIAAVKEALGELDGERGAA